MYYISLAILLQPKNTQMFAKTFIKIVVATIFVVAGSFFCHGQESTDIPKFDDQTERIWKAHCVVPKTDNIKELRAFLKYQTDQWVEMNGHLREKDDWDRFHNAKNRATFDAANRIIALAKVEPGEEPAPPKTKEEYYGWNDDDDAKFALRQKMMAFNGAREWDPDWEKHFQEFIREMKKNPEYKYVVKVAENSWFSSHFNAAVFTEGYSFDEQLRRYGENFENLKKYCSENTNDPCLKFAISNWQTIQMQAVEVLERSGKIKKGTLAKPALEFYRALFQKYSDVPEAEGWLRNIDNDLVKYDILTATDPAAAFQAAVEKLKTSLENGLDENSWQKVGGLSQIAEDMDSRNQSLRLLLTTVRPLFAASENEKIRNYALGFNLQLKHLALEGKPFEFEAILLDGQKIDLKDFRGKVVILDYWATSCGPCVGETPMLKTFYKNWKERGVELIGFSVDEDLETLKKYVEKESLPWPNASEKLSKERNLPDSRKKYEIDSYPTTILIDQNGNVVRAGSGLYSVIMNVGKLLPPEDKKK